jgi:predicted nicotinamide N-methyase
MVREKERQTDDPIVVEVVLPRDILAAETETERVMAAVDRYLSSGRPVVLGTDERDGHTVRPVLDRIDLGRRLARAVPAPVASPDPGRSWP